MVNGVTVSVWKMAKSERWTVGTVTQQHEMYLMPPSRARRRVTVVNLSTHACTVVGTGEGGTKKNRLYAQGHPAEGWARPREVSTRATWTGGLCSVPTQPRLGRSGSSPVGSPDKSPAPRHGHRGGREEVVTGPLPLLTPSKHR